MSIINSLRSLKDDTLRGNKTPASKLPERLVGTWSVIEFPDMGDFAPATPETLEWTFREDGSFTTLGRSVGGGSRTLPITAEMREVETEGRLDVTPLEDSSFPDSFRVTGYTAAIKRMDAYLICAGMQFNISWLLLFFARIFSGFSQQPSSIAFVGDRLEYHVKGFNRPFVLAKRSKPTVDLRTHNSAEKRAFFPNSKDKTGRIQLRAVVKDVPPGATFLWSKIGAWTLGELTFTAPDKLETEVIAVRPAITLARFEVFDPKSGARIAKDTVLLSVPQFFTVEEEVNPHDTVNNQPVNTFRRLLEEYSLLNERREVLEQTKEVVEFILHKVNVRIFWLMPPFNEVLPPGFSWSENVSRVILKDRPNTMLLPEHQAGLTFSPFGPEIPNEQIWVMPGGAEVGYKFSNDFVAIKERMKNILLSDPHLKPLWMTIVSRLIGVIMAHEMLHSLIGKLTGPGGHHDPPIQNDIMNEGEHLDLVGVTGIEITDPKNFPNPGSFIDGGLGALLMITLATERNLNEQFPVPPQLK